MNSDSLLLMLVNKTPPLNNEPSWRFTIRSNHLKYFYTRGENIENLLYTDLKYSEPFIHWLQKSSRKHFIYWWWNFRILFLFIYTNEKKIIHRLRTFYNLMTKTLKSFCTLMMNTLKSLYPWIKNLYKLIHWWQKPSEINFYTDD